MKADRVTAAAVATACAATLLLEYGGSAAAMALGLLLLAAVVVRPVAAVFALLVGSPLSRFGVATGTESDLEFAVLFVPFLAALWVASRVYERDWGVLRAPPTWPLLGLAAVAVAAFARANLAAVDFPLASLRVQLAGVATFLVPIATALAAGEWVRRRGELASLQVLFLLLGAGLIATRAVPEFQDRWSPFAPRADGSLMWVWTLTLAFAHAWLNRSLHWAYRLALAVVVGGGLFYGLGPNRIWVAGWLPPLVGIAAVITAVLPRLGLAALLVGAGALALGREVLTSYFMVGDNAYSLATRLEAGAILLRIAATHPLLGLGPVNYYPATALHEIRGYRVSFSSHNNYLDLLAQTGALGLLLFVAFLTMLAWRVWRRREAAIDPPTRAFVYGALGGLAGSAVAAAIGDWVIPFVYNTTLSGLRACLPGWIFFGCLLRVVENLPAGASHAPMGSARR